VIEMASSEEPTHELVGCLVEWYWSDDDRGLSDNERVTQSHYNVSSMLATV
jgi:hypothetical protein